MKHNWEYTQTDKTSVRVHHAPGGNSQISFGDSGQTNQYQGNYQNQSQNFQTSYQKQSYDGYYGQAPSSNMVSAGAPTRQKEQYSGGKASVPSYHYQQEMHRQEEAAKFGEEKTSVKVHNPPGGRSNFSYGFEEQPSQQQSYLQQKDLNKRSYQQDDNRWDGPAFGAQPKKSYNQQDQFGGRSQKQQYQDNNIFGSYQQDNYEAPRQAFSYQAPKDPKSQPTFGQRIEAGSNCGPTTEKSSVKLHAPPGGKSSIQFF